MYVCLLHSAFKLPDLFHQYNFESCCTKFNTRQFPHCTVYTTLECCTQRYFLVSALMLCIASQLYAFPQSMCYISFPPVSVAETTQKLPKIACVKNNSFTHLHRIQLAILDIVKFNSMIVLMVALNVSQRLVKHVLCLSWVRTMISLLQIIHEQKEELQWTSKNYMHKIFYNKN